MNTLAMNTSAMNTSAKNIKAMNTASMDIKQKYEICVSSLKDYVGNAGFTDVVIGLSGGLDSSVVAALCVEAFGAKHVHGVLMPGPYSTDHSISDAQDLAQGLKIDTVQMSICEPYEAFEKVFEASAGKPLSGLASENTQARCRMIFLMALSNANNWLVINTGNKSEAMMGYSTLYGDTCGAFAPIGGLYKTDVFAMAKWMNEQAENNGGSQVIPVHIINKPPSAELSAGQEDETSLGIAYKDLDAILIAAFEDGKPAKEIAKMGYEMDEVERVITRANSMAFKRAMEPPCPDVAFYVK